MTTLYETDAAEIAALLIGHSVVKVSDDTLILDDGRRLTFVGHEGGCSCGSGDYELTELNGVDNIITEVTLAELAESDDLEGRGHYKIFVFADNQRINLATFEGYDGNGYYGTGYSIQVVVPASTP